MAFGLLGSIIPQINRNEIFYTASAPDLTVGKVSISSKNYNPVKIRLGITTDNLNIDYLIYNKFINYGETFETNIIYLGDGQKLVARSTDPNVNFVFYGQTHDETSNPVKSGLLGSVKSTNFEKKVLYTAPENSNAIVTLSACNLDSQPGKARIGISSTGIDSFDSSKYLEYDVEISPNQSYTRTEIKLDAGQTLICSSNQDSNINFLCYGQLTYGAVTGEDLYIPGNLGIGIIDPRERLDVNGNALISGSITVSGTIDGFISTSSLNQSLINLNALPRIDGSLLTGVIATGSGVFIEENGANLGAATTINFGDGVDAIYSENDQNRITIALSPTINILENFSVATNKFTVSGVNGNTQVGGTLGIASTLSVSGNINALNNKVINVGSATSSTDATNKNYVDTRSIAMSIALS